jgi:hypothetical protein
LVFDFSRAEIFSQFSYWYLKGVQSALVNFEKLIYSSMW